MCTAITFQSKDHYFGRNLDFEYSYKEGVTITPRNALLPFRMVSDMQTHFAIIGMAMVEGNYPLYYDATNEHGLSMAGLYFPGNAIYLPIDKKKDNIAPFELVLWILGQCVSVDEAELKLNRLNIVNIPFSDKYPLSPLHWMIADKHRAITVEPTKAGIQIYENPVGVLTNNPPFDYHLYNLSNYLNLTSDEPTNRFAPNQNITAYSRGMGAIGLPGDLSSASRFIRASFVKLNSVCDQAESSSVSQFFHILDSVAQQKGCVRLGSDYEKTIYSCCCNTDKGIYYYTTYDNSQITGVDMRNTDLTGRALITFPLILEQQIRMEN